MEKGPFDFLRDPDLYDLLGRMARRRFPDEPATAEDVRQNALIAAMELVLKGRRPRAGHERGWTCFVLKNYAKKVWAKRGEAEPLVVTTDEPPDIPVEDELSVLEGLLDRERMYDTTEQTVEKFPKHAADLQIEDGRKNESGAKDSAARKRKERARQFFKAAIGTALGALVLFFILRPLRKTPTPNSHLPPVWTDATLASASREIGMRYCAAHRWRECIAGLDQAKDLDASQSEAGMRAARKAAVMALRDEGFAACEQSDWSKCLSVLHEVARYDEDVAKEPWVQLALSEASWHTPASAPTVVPEKIEYDAKGPRP